MLEISEFANYAKMINLHKYIIPMEHDFTESHTASEQIYAEFLHTKENEYLYQQILWLIWKMFNISGKRTGSEIRV